MTAENLAHFLTRPIKEILLLTPRQQAQLRTLGIETIDDFLHSDLDAEIIPLGIKKNLEQVRDEMRQKAEVLRAAEIDEVPLPIPLFPKSESNKISPAAPELPPVVAPPQSGAHRIQGDFIAGYLWTKKESSAELGEALRIPWDDLRRHAFVCGGIGSGKTVLSKALIEQAAISGIPSVIVDPASDLAFLALRPPFIQSDEDAVRYTKELTKRFATDEDAESIYKNWANVVGQHRDLQKRGGISAEFVDEVRRLSFVRLYAPKSDSYGIQIALPPFSPNLFQQLKDENAEDYENRLDELVSTLLSSLQMDAQRIKRIGPVIKKLLRTVSASEFVNPPLEQLLEYVKSISARVNNVRGVPIEELLKPEDIRELQRSIVAFLEGPESAWLRGQCLDFEELFRKDNASTPINVIYIGHLSVRDQQYAIFRIVSEMEKWARSSASSKPGTRAVLYIDELGGGGGREAFCPPIAAPISKPPLLRMIRQGRKYGIGVLLASQNVKDIDYKGLGNIKNWFAGCMTSANDQRYLKEGIAQAAFGNSGICRGELDRFLPALRPGMFLHIGSSGAANVFKGRYLASLHRQPFPEYYSHWKREFIDEAKASVHSYLRSRDRSEVPIIFRNSGFFEKLLLAEMRAEPEMGVNAIYALQWLLNKGAALRSDAFGLLVEKLNILNPADAKKWLTIALDSQLDERSISLLRSMMVGAKLVSEAPDAACKEAEGLQQPQKSWWKAFILRVIKWRIPKSDVRSWTAYDGEKTIRVENLNIKAQSRTIDIKKTCEGIRGLLLAYIDKIPEDVLLRWYQEQCPDDAKKAPSGSAITPDAILDVLVNKQPRHADQLKIAERMGEYFEHIDPIEFEHVVARYLRTKGWGTELTKASGDGGVDILATKSDGQKCAVQCKRYSHAVGPGIIREVEGARKLYGCDASMVVTSSRFSVAAKEAAKTLSVDLIDGDLLTIELLRMEGA